MAVAIPIIASFAAASSAVAAAGGIVAALGTVSGFLSIAGAALTGIGAITGKRDVMKVGSLMTLGGGLIGSMGGGTAAAAEAGSEASAAWDMPGSAAGSDAAQFGKYAAPAAEGTTNLGIEGMVEEAAKAGAGSVDAAAAADATSNAFDYPDALSMGAQNTTPYSQAMSRSAEHAAMLEANAPELAIDPLTEGASRMTSAELQSGLSRGPAARVASQPLRLSGIGTDGAPLVQVNDSAGAGGIWDRMSGGVDKLGQHVRKNKELYALTGNVLGSVYGPAAEQMDFEKSIMARRLRNLNSPVALRFGGGT